MRIIAGDLKGSKLFPPNNKNIRPLKDIARENIFNLLTHSNKIKFKFSESYVLDLYAGTGSFGLECLSRRSQYVYFVEKEKEAFDILNKNIEKLKLTNKTRVLFDDVFKIIKNEYFFDIKFDLIFCDPPFKNKKILEIIELILNKQLLKRNGIIIFHRNKNIREKIPNNFKILDERIYGISKIIIGKSLT